MDKNELFERLEIAPMLDRTDAHFRRLVRLLNRRVTLYTEMIPAAALAHGARPERFLTRFDGESPVAMQLAGNDPKELAAAVKAALPFGFDEIDLNCGCPSTRVQAGSFGAYLMATPDIVRDCVDAMRDAAGRDIVTVKTRIALDDRTSGDGYDKLAAFAETVGVRKLIVHARKARLNLSVHANRTTLPLYYDAVYRLKRDRPDLCVVINGDINSLTQARTHLDRVDRAMMGRAVWQNPFLISDGRLTRDEAAGRYLDYARATGQKLAFVKALYLYHAQPNAKAWKEKVIGMIKAQTNAPRELRPPDQARRFFG